MKTLDLLKNLVAQADQAKPEGLAAQLRASFPGSAQDARLHAIATLTTYKAQVAQELATANLLVKDKDLRRKNSLTASAKGQTASRLLQRVISSYDELKGYKLATDKAGLVTCFKAEVKKPEAMSLEVLHGITIHEGIDLEQGIEAHEVDFVSRASLSADRIKKFRELFPLGGLDVFAFLLMQETSWESETAAYEEAVYRSQAATRAAEKGIFQARLAEFKSQVDILKNKKVPAEQVAALLGKAEPELFEAWRAAQ